MHAQKALQTSSMNSSKSTTSLISGDAFVTYIIITRSRAGGEEVEELPEHVSWFHRNLRSQPAQPPHPKCHGVSQEI